MTNLVAQLRAIDEFYNMEDREAAEFDPLKTTELEFETDECPTPESRKARKHAGWEPCWKNKDTGAIRYARPVSWRKDGH